MVLIWIPAWIAAAAIGSTRTASDPPTIRVTSDDTVIETSCRIEIPEGAVIEDRDGDGVIHVTRPDVVVEFTRGSVLRGAPRDRRPDEYRGYGIRVKGRSGVTIRGARIEGFWGGIWCTEANGLRIEECDVSDIRRAHLKSTPVAEDGGDWLWPHKNDDNEWLKNYGAAIYVEDSEKVTIRRCRTRRSQNGICLDRVSKSRVFDNDCSFLSGWGLAMWRSCGNTVSCNAFDFCIRGYSHGVYNRGQDSAGILFFEQNCDNVIVDNSATHGGDGFFGFGGREALGDEAPPGFNCKRKGCNDNKIGGNDFSYAAAHGIELTFSFGNQIRGNRLVGNAICGIWGGYSQETIIIDNEIAENGDMGYGLERGGVNIDSGRNNHIENNAFRENKCGIHLWDNRGGDLAKKPWGVANRPMSVDNVIGGNSFHGDELACHFRGPCETIMLMPDKMTHVKNERIADAEAKFRESGSCKHAYSASGVGETRPVGARTHLRGRENIIMTEWGPWDHESPLIRPMGARGRERSYEFHRFGDNVDMRLEGDGLTSRSGKRTAAGAIPYAIVATRDGVFPYKLMVRNADTRAEQTVQGTMVVADWDVRFFAWTESSDPRKDLAAYQKLADGPEAIRARCDHLQFKYGHGGPANLRAPDGKPLWDGAAQSKLGADRFGMRAATRLVLPRGRWRFATMSDDGVRVTVNGRRVIDNWTWHVPTRDEGTYEQEESGPVDIVVEHFEIDGFAVIELEIEPAG